MALACVVCGGGIEGEPFYGNAWERARKMFGCCSDACAGRFDADVHWLPSARPPAASWEDEARLVRVARDRVDAGDRPALVVRELLVAGVAIPAVRKIVIDASLGAQASRKEAGRQSALAVVRAVLTLRLSVVRNTDKRDPELLQTAERDLETWKARFPP